ncbi:hypothetical protein MRB53_010335 [Persea americana]|uniref:Uncharacterized protein n=1 Tax=Persea americana TaxID=3435 RepID=A0ACC2LRQ1_PERAE|nr:hypothetical protein MRB53_010335 [Persea americana]
MSQLQSRPHSCECNKPFIMNEQERHWHHDEIECLGQGAEKPSEENLWSSLPPYAFPGVLPPSVKECEHNKSNLRGAIAIAGRQGATCSLLCPVDPANRVGKRSLESAYQ